MDSSTASSGQHAGSVLYEQPPLSKQLEFKQLLSPMLLFGDVSKAPFPLPDEIKPLLPSSLSKSRQVKSPPFAAAAADLEIEQFEFTESKPSSSRKITSFSKSITSTFPFVPNPFTFFNPELSEPTNVTESPPSLPNITASISSTLSSSLSTLIATFSTSIRRLTLQFSEALTHLPRSRNPPLEN